MKKIVYGVISFILLIGCGGNNMATIGEEVNGVMVSTNVTDDTDVFNNTVFQNYPYASRYSYGDSIYQNTGEDISVVEYDASATYSVDDIVFKDGILTRVLSIDAGTFPKQPEDYSAVDTAVIANSWGNRYLKFVDRGPDESLYGVSATLSYSDGKSMVFNSAKTKLYVATSGTLYQYSLATAGDIETLSLDKSVVAYDPDIVGIAFNDDETKMYHITYGTKKIYQFALSTAGDIATLSYEKEMSTLGTGYDTPSSISLSGDGLKLITTDEDNMIFISELTIKDDIGSIGSTVSQSLSVTTLKDGKFNSDGSQMYILDSDVKTLHLSGLATPYDYTTVSYTSDLDVGSYSVTTFLIESDGKTLFTLYSNNILRYTTADSTNISNAKYATFPATVSEYNSETANTETYKITSDKTSYTLTSSWENSGATASVFTDMTAYTHLDSSTIEEKANVDASTNVWTATTLIIRDDGLYIRTSIDAAIETEILTDTQFTTVTQPTDMDGFSRIQYMNQYRPFDGANNTPATSQSPMEYIIKGLEVFNAFTLAKVLATSVTYSFILPESDSDYDLWLDGVEVLTGGNGVIKTEEVDIDCRRDATGTLSLYPTTVIFYAGRSMPIDSTVSITLVHSDTISLGDFTLNNIITDWMTNLDFSHSIQDFNDYTPDDWGNIPEAVKAIVTKYNISMDVYLTNYDHSVSFFESIAGKFVTIDASDSDGSAPNGVSIFGSLIRRVMVTSCSHKSVVKDGELWRMGNLTMSVQEVV